MYRQMYNPFVHNGLPNMPIPPYRQQTFSKQGLRNHPFPYANQLPFSNYPQPEMNPQFQSEMTGVQQGLYYPQQEGGAQHVFQNPLKAAGKTSIHSQQQVPPYHAALMNPYPKASFIAQPPSGMKNILNSFKSQDGSLDVNKMVDTAGQMINAVSQVSSVVKGLGGLFKA